MFYDGGAMMGGMHGLWWIFWVVLIAGLVFYVWARPGKRRHGPRESPHDVLRRRLAHGELTPEQYEQRKALIDRDGGASAGSSAV